MQKTPLSIALAAAGIVVATAGVAAITTGVAPTIAPAIEQPTVQQTQVEVQAPAETQAAAETQTQVVVDKPATSDVAAPVVRATQAQPQPVAAARGDEERMVRVPFTNFMVRVTNPTFPSAAVELGEWQPEAIAYLEQVEQRRLAAAKPAPVAAKADTAVIPMPGTEATVAQPPQVTAQATPAN